MSKFFQNVLATVAAAGLIGNVAMLWHFSERLTCLETKIELMTITNHIVRSQ
jgi:hypothetical protein